MSSLLNIEHLSIGYNNKVIVSDINCKAKNGELVAILGRNGSGKSTFIKTLCSIIPPISGNVYVNNKSIFKVKDIGQTIGVVLTDKTIINNMSVRDYVAYGRYPYSNWLNTFSKKDNDNIETAINICNIDYLTNKLLTELSDGERQRVDIARVIAQNTPIILLDEPTAHLDIVNKKEVFTLLKTLAKNYNKTILISTHHIDNITDIANQAWVFSNGKFSVVSQNIASNKQVILDTIFNTSLSS